MSAQTTPINGAKPHPATPDKRHYDRAEKMTRIQNMHFVDWMRALGEPDGRFKTFIHKNELCEQASKALGFKVTITALNDYLSAYNLKMPDAPQKAAKEAQKTAAQQLSDDIAAVALALSAITSAPEIQRQMLEIADRRTSAGA